MHSKLERHGVQNGKHDRHKKPQERNEVANGQRTIDVSHIGANESVESHGTERRPCRKRRRGSHA